MLRFFTTLEKISIVFLLIVMGATSYYLYDRYIREHSDLIAVDGGIYTEGVVGRPAFLNPVLLTGNTVDRDISHLVFSGLTRYNPHTGLIEDDIATTEISNDNLSYTFTLVPDAVWHDGEAVTADDILFTYTDVIQNSQFSNTALQKSFDGITIEKVDDRAVRFTLAEPNSFFLANVTIGLLPKHHFSFIPVENLDKSELNQAPIGSGPYRFSNWSVLNDTHEITLQRFDDYYAAQPKVETVIIRAFPDQSSLLLAENTLTGFRLQSGQSPDEIFGSTSRFESFPYHLPQYTAFFLNTQSPILSNKKVRFALLLGTDKDEIAEIVGNAEVVDTPVLEAKDDLDIEYSLERAMGAFFDTEWNLPSKVKARLEAEGESEAEEDASGGPLEEAAIQEADMLSFTLEAVEDSWISLATDGVQQASFLLSEGDSKSYSVTTSLLFTTIGNAAGPQITVNGVALRSLGGSGEVVRNLTLDRTTLLEYIDDSVAAEVVVDEVVEESEDEETPSTPEESTEEESEEDVEEDEIEDVEDETINEELSTEEEVDQVRINDNGDRLILRLVTAQEPEIFLQVAEAVQRQWLQAGAKVVIETYSLPELQQKIQERDYDVLLFGQNLGYNLDTFPFWHSSQAEDGLNLSDYRSLEADNLLVDIRKTFDERTKQELLDRLKRTIAEDTPAVFLYNPTHYFVIDSAVKNVELNHLSSHSDRLTDLLNWYIKEDYELRESFSFSGLINWLFSWNPQP